MTEDDMRRMFAKRLADAMREQGFTQAELARKANTHYKGEGEINRDNISRYCGASSIPGPNRLMAIAKALGKDHSDLLPARAMPSITSPITLEQAGNGLARFRIDKEIPWDIALEIMNLLQKAGLTDAGINDQPSGGRVRSDRKDGPTVALGQKNKSVVRHPKRPR